MNRRAFRFVLLYSLLLILLTSIPYFIGFQENPGWEFSGFLFGVEDGNSYIAKMRRGSEGAWLFRTPYTSMEQAGVLIFLPYTLIGKLAGGTEIHTQLVLLYQLFRWVAIFAYVYAVFLFLDLFVRDFFWKLIGVLLATAGGGLGWLVLLSGRAEIFGSLPLDFYSPETFGFLSILGLPHLIASRASLLAGLVVFLKAIEGEGRAVLAGFLILLAGIFQPLAMVIAVVLLGAYLCALLLLNASRFLRVDLRRLFKASFLTAIVPAPYFIYLMFSFTFDPFLSEWTTQNVIRSPHPLHYLLAFLILLLPAGFGVWVVLRERSLKGILLLVWVILLPFMAYAPYNLQRRLPDGVWIALIALGLIAFSSWSIKDKRVRWAGIPLTLVLIPSSLVLILGAGMAAVQLGPPVFQPQGQVDAFKWLDDHFERDPVVLASYQTGNALPAWAHVRVPAGHGPESIRLAFILPQIEDFFNHKASISDQDRVEWLEWLNVDLVFQGPNERALGSWDLSGAAFLSEVYRQAGYSIYVVQREP